MVDSLRLMISCRRAAACRTAVATAAVTTRAYAKERTCLNACQDTGRRCTGVVGERGATAHSFEHDEGNDDGTTRSDAGARPNGENVRADVNLSVSKGCGAAGVQRQRVFFRARRGPDPSSERHGQNKGFKVCYAQWAENKSSNKGARRCCSPRCSSAT